MNNKVVSFLLITTIFLFSKTTFAQQPSGFTQFFINSSALNPSYTGIDGKPAAFFGFRRQWSGLDGGPSIGYLNLQAALPTQVLVGATFVNDSKGVINTSSALFTGGYSVPLANEQYLRFGLSVGGAWNKVDINNLYFVNPSDPILANLASSNAEVIGNAGVSFHTKTFHAGLAIPNLFEPTYVATEGFTFAKVNPMQSLVFNLSNRFYFAKGKNAVEPYVIYRLNSSLPSQLEVATVLHLQNLVWLGASYKQDFGISGLAGFKLNKTAALGYSYSMKNTGDNQLPFPTHEIHLAFLFGDHKKNLPMYSVINTEVLKHKKSPKELLAEKKKKEALLAKKNEELQALQSQPKKTTTAPPKKEESKPVVTQNKPAEKPAETKPAETKPAETKPAETQVTQNKPAETKPAETQLAQNKPAETKPAVQGPSHSGGPRKRNDYEPLVIELDSVPEHERDQHLHEQEILGRVDEHKDDPDAEHNEENHPNAERHEFVQRGDHPEEMNLADYVIVGAFRSKANAEKYDIQMVNMGFPEVHYGFLSARNLWYVYVAASDDLEQAKTARDKYRKMKMFKDAWLLTVHD